MIELRIDPAFDDVSCESPNILSLRDQLNAWCKHIAAAASKMRELGNQSDLIDAFFLDALNLTSDRAEPDAQKLTSKCIEADYILQLVDYLGSESSPEYQKDTEKQILEAVAAMGAADEATVAEVAAQGSALSASNRKAQLGDSAFGLHETIFSGLHGVAEVARAAMNLSTKCRRKREFEAVGLRERISALRPREKKDKEARVELTAQVEKIEAENAEWHAREREALDGIVDVLAFLAGNPTDLDQLAEYALKVGKLAADAFEIYELGAKYTFGEPVPVGVRTSPLAGLGVVFSGDDFSDLTKLLERAEFSDFNVWTYGEAIAAHSLPAFSKFRRLAGHYGGARCDQNKDLGAFPGAIVVSSGAFDEPSGSYADYAFSTKRIRWSSVRALERKEDGSLKLESVVKGASDSGGFSKNKPIEKIPVGFGGDQLPSLVEKSARAYRSGDLKRVYVIGGEDVPEAEKDCFLRLFDNMPQDAIALTYGDVKFRFNRKPSSPTKFGTPRLIDLGRVRDMNATLRFAANLNKELDRAPENSPVSFFVSIWGEKSVASLLAVCASGYRDVVVGPYRPTIWNDEVVGVLRDKLGVRLTDDPDADAPDANPS